MNLLYCVCDLWTYYWPFFCVFAWSLQCNNFPRICILPRKMCHLETVSGGLLDTFSCGYTCCASNLELWPRFQAASCHSSHHHLLYFTKPTHSSSARAQRDPPCYLSQIRWKSYSMTVMKRVPHSLFPSISVNCGQRCVLRDAINAGH